MKTGSLRLFGSVSLVSLLSLLGAPFASQAGGTVVGWGGGTIPVGLTNVAAIAAGYAHGLALNPDTTVTAWGTYWLSDIDFGRDYVPTLVPAGLSNVVAVAGGMDHSLALMADGAVVAWGTNTDGQLDVPAGLSNVAAIAAGTKHSLALRADGTVVAWGLNDSGQTNVPPGLTNVVAVAGGGGHSLALKADGTVVGWGSDYYGQTDPPGNLTNAVAIAAGPVRSLALKADGTVVMWGGNWDGSWTVPAGLSNVVALSAGDDGTLALKADGTVVGWGYNFSGESTVPKGLTNVAAIAAGGYQSLALVGGGPPFVTTALMDRVTVTAGTAYFRVEATGARPLSYQWRFNGSDIPGEANSVLCLTNAQAAQAGSYSVVVSNALGLAASRSASLAVVAVLISNSPLDQRTFVGGTATFSVAALGAAPLSYQWRRNGTDLEGATNSSLTLTNVQSAEAGSYSVVVSNIFGGGISSAALLTVVPILISTEPADQVAFIGGQATFGIAAQGTTPLSYEWSLNGTEIEGGTNPTLVLTNVQPSEAGTCSVVVSNRFGTLFGTASRLSVVPVAVWGVLDQNAVPSNLTNVGAVAAGYGGGLALTPDNTVVAWGGLTTLPPNLTNVVALASGIAFNEALRTDGTVTAWGNRDAAEPNVPKALTNAVAVAARYSHSLALTAEGRVVAWDTSSGIQTPTPPDWTNLVAVAAGGYHSLALKADGTVVAWGDNRYGQTNIPPDLTNIIAIAAGDWHNLALKADGTVIGFGYDAYGQSSPPAGLTNAVAIACGNFHSLALKADGTVVAWGDGTEDTGRYPELGQAIVPPGLKNVMAIAGGDYASLALVRTASPVFHVAMANPTCTPNGFSVSVPTQSGRVYRLEYKNSLADGNWTALPLVAGNGGVRTLSDPTAAGAQRFYRVRQW